MGTIATTVALAIVGVAVSLLWERLRPRRQNETLAGEQEVDASGRIILAYSFHSDLSFADAIRLLGAAESDGKESGPAAFGNWFERDSAWWPQLLSCREHRGMGMNLYFLDSENVLELKFARSDANPLAAEAFALHELLPTLGARDVKPTDSMN